MSNSSLVTYTNLTRNHSGRRTQPITKIAIHHMYAIWTGKQCADYFATTDRQASSNYCIGYDGDIALGVEEKNRAWTTSSNWCDQRAITIEVANTSLSGNTPVSDASMKALIELCVDICKRNNIKECTYTGDTSGVLQKHSWYAATSCPGVYLGGKFAYIAEEVNKRLKGGTNNSTNSSTTTKPTTTNYTVKVTADVLNIRKGAGTSYDIVGAIKDKGTYTIVQESNGWGKLKSEAGWISLAYTSKAPAHTSQSGTWRFNTTVRIRSTPSTKSGDTGLVYTSGMTVNISSTQVADGYVWGKYISHSGKTRYVALQKVNGVKHGAWV